MRFDRIDARDFLGALGIDVLGVSGHNLTFRCPWHGADRHPSARMSIRDTRWLCSSCGEKGNAVHFLAKLRNMSYDEAKSHIERRYGLGPAQAIGELEQEVARNLAPVVHGDVAGVAPSETWIEFFCTSWDADFSGLHALTYMEGRGFDRRILDEWEIGYDPVSRRVAIAVRDVEGHLVGFKARAIYDDQEPRYLILGDSPGRQLRYGFDTYHKSHHVYGLQRVPLGSRVVVVEGELNVVAIAQKCPHLHAVGVAGAEFSERQRALIAERCSAVTIYFDADLAGQKGAQKVVETLSPYLLVSVVIGAWKDAAELDGDEIEGLVENAVPGLELIASR
jgi:DNA primase